MSIENPVICGDCTAPMQLRAGKFGYFFACSTFPKCRATHPADKDGMPVGAPVDSQTGALRRELTALIKQITRAHNDTLPPKLKKHYRRAAYLYLAHHLPWKERGVECLVVNFSKEQCETALEIFRKTDLLAILRWHTSWRIAIRKRHGRASVPIMSEIALGRITAPLNHTPR